MEQTRWLSDAKQTGPHGGSNGVGRDPMNAVRIALSLDDRRLLGQWAADCAERVLALYEAVSPSDPRPREAIDGIRIFARGGDRTVRLRSVALAALDAARETGDPAAAAAARAAGLAASTAYTKALATPTMPNMRWGRRCMPPARRSLRAVIRRWATRNFGGRSPMRLLPCGRLFPVGQPAPPAAPD